MEHLRHRLCPRRWIAVAAALALMSTGGCRDTPRPPPLPPADFDDLLGPSCLPEDSSRGLDSAWEIPTAALVDGTPVSDTLCPQYDSDYWRLAVSGERQLVEVELTYNRAGEIELAVDWFGPLGLCVPSAPVACATNDDCASGQRCDLERGGCRAAVPPECYGPAHCPGESCATAEGALLRGPILRLPGSGVSQRIQTLLPAFRPGTYTLRVYDRAAAVEDPVTRYQLTVRQRQDTDAHEPNDAPHLATALASDTPQTGTFSYAGDVDFFRVTPAGGGRAVVFVDLTYPDGMPAVPSFRLHQGAAAPIPAGPPLAATGGRHRSVAWVMPGDEPITVEVFNTTGALAPTHSYTLAVKVIDDADEPTRDDTAASARPLDLGAPGGAATVNQRLIAENDADWLAVSKTGADQSLLELRLTAASPTPADAPFLLLLQAYFPSTTPCDTTNDCDTDLSTGRPEVCLVDYPSPGQGRCAVWFQRPAIEVPLDRLPECAAELGGCPAQRNDLHTQIPLPPAGGPPLLLLVRHNENTPLAKLGYSETVGYTLTLTHHQEPDDGDRTTPDSLFVPRPLAGPDGIDKAGFYLRARELALAGADTTSSAGATTGQSHALLTSAAVLEATGCAPLSFAAFDPSGAATTATVTFAGAEVATFSDTGCTAPAASAVVTSSRTIYATTTAAAGTTTTLTASVGPTTIPFTLAVHDGTPPPAILLAATAARAGTVGALGPLVTATVPEATSASLRARVIAGSAGVACHALPTSPTTEACPNMTGLSGGCTIDGSTDDCLLPLVNSAAYGLHLVPGALALAAVEVSAPGFAPAVVVLAPLSPASFGFTNTSDAGRGYISYAGDADFFRLSAPALGDGHMTVTLNYAGEVRVRVGVTRADDDDGWCTAPYGCGISVEGPNCASDCVQPTPSTACNYVFQPGDQLNVWVNAVGHDAFDRLNPYRFWFTYDEGCPASCSQYVCGQ